MRGRRALPLALALAALAGCSSSGEAGRERAPTEPVETAPPSAPPRSGEPPASKPAASDPEPRVIVGAQEGVAVPLIALGDRLERPTRLEPSSDAVATDMRWSGWGEATARGVGIAGVNRCRPNCAEGRIERRRGLVAELTDLRPGNCAGSPARFYTRVTVRYPEGLGLPTRRVLVLLPRCLRAR